MEPFIDRRHRRHDPTEGGRGHAEAGRHADAFDARELPELRTLAADNGAFGPVDLFESQHVAVHPSTLPLNALRRLSSLPSVALTPVIRLGVHCHHTGGPCGKPPTFV